ncbi:hypothetical protein [Sphingomonas yantingensis]|uniref:Lipoprotein n=1 Tax=Sphingomonas yantingensis TaxID=1241761 RepID=A0A7W9EGD1_9SPHN|nr:hypothetical protein [Sphingomonas yantingensis]MBB5697002.1 hypothetical protein [Sphingomonas yantingensis]
MVKGKAALIGAVLLSGCASTNEVMQMAPTQVFKSDKSADEVSFCLANRNNTVPMPRDDGSRVVLVKNGYGAVSLAFAVFPEGTGSRIEYRKKFGTIGGAWKRCVGIKPDKD